jgi:dihydroorotate dehydrogenase
MPVEFHQHLIDPVLSRLDSERSHDVAREILHLAGQSPFALRVLSQLSHRMNALESDRLHVHLAQGKLHLENPLLVGAGWDKKGECVSSLYAMGFAGVEVGTVLLNPQKGNEKPRQFYHEDGVALNRLGFNSPGMQTVGMNLKSSVFKMERERPEVVGISVGKNKDIPDSDAAIAHANVVEYLYNYADYFAINVSSPNTPGLRGLQAKGPLTEIVHAVNERMDRFGKRKPLYVKIAPELTGAEIDDVIQVVMDNGLTGIIAVNTTIKEHTKKRYGWTGQKGGVSGNDPEYIRRANDVVRQIYNSVGGRIDIIGVGGIHDAQSAWDRIINGASAIQLVTAIRSEGIGVAGEINRGLKAKMKDVGISSIAEAVGADIRGSF